MRVVFALLFFVCSTASAQHLLKIAQPVWAGLAPHERSAIQQRHVIELADPETYGVIIDNQGVNESTAGSSAGSNLGQALANAAYVDRSFRDGNYSAKGQLGAILLGGIIGSALDTAPVSRFHYRYTVRLGNGNIRYVDEVASDPFRHPIGICVNLPTITVAADQQLCTQDLHWLRTNYLAVADVAPSLQRGSVQPYIRSVSQETATPAEAASTQLIECKISSLAPVRTTVEKCRLTNGTVIQ